MFRHRGVSVVEQGAGRRLSGAAMSPCGPIEGRPHARVQNRPHQGLTTRAGAGDPIDALPEEIGVAGMAGVLDDHVAVNPAQGDLAACETVALITATLTTLRIVGDLDKTVITTIALKRQAPVNQ